MLYDGKPLTLGKQIKYWNQMSLVGLLIILLYQWQCLWCYRYDKSHCQSFASSDPQTKGILLSWRVWRFTCRLALSSTSLSPFSIVRPNSWYWERYKAESTRVSSKVRRVTLAVWMLGYFQEFSYSCRLLIINLSQVIAAEGEQKAARALKEASDVISESSLALQLRYLQTLSTISAEKNSTIIFPMPIEFLNYAMQSSPTHSQQRYYDSTPAGD